MTFEELQELAKRRSPRPKPFEMPPCDKRCYADKPEAQKTLDYMRGTGKFRKGRAYFCEEHKAWHITKN